MSLFELCLIKKIFPKKPLDRQRLSLWDKGIFAKKVTKIGDCGGRVLFLRDVLMLSL